MSILLCPNCGKMHAASGCPEMGFPLYQVSTTPPTASTSIEIKLDRIIELLEQIAKGVFRI
jgi:hypothetical protein